MAEAVSEMTRVANARRQKRQRKEEIFSHRGKPRIL
jgi:hypothetical protein